MNARLVQGLVFVILLNLIPSSSSKKIVYPCVTPGPEHESTYCVSLFSCPHLMKSLATLNPEAIDYFKKSICLGCRAGDFMVCCGTPKYFAEITTTSSQPPPTIPTILPEEAVIEAIVDPKEARREYVRTKLLPSQRICGQQHTDDRVYLENETALDEFPWIVHLFLLNLDDYTPDYLTICTGVLISNRYVLTDHECGNEAFRVRLGEHSTHQDVSCVQESPLLTECTDKVVIKKIEKKILNEEFSRADLMLIRLNETVQYSDYIRPICLPIAGSERPTSENYLTFSGFGAADGKEVVKKRLTYNLTNTQVCYDADGWFKEKHKSDTTTLTCVEPPPGNTLDACYAEHGGPLMYRHKFKWFAEAIIIEVVGILSQNISYCSTTRPVAGVYLTPTVMDWILDNIED